MSKDEIFKDASSPIGDFSFNKEVATVFYDMLHRSVPYYQEIQRMIAKKRESLQNVLIPYRLLENRELLLKQGFRYCDIFFRWYSFCGLVAVK